MPIDISMDGQVTPRCTKDRIEEMLFPAQRDLFPELELVFFDTTSIYFEGRGSDTIGKRGFSKDHRPDLKQVAHNNRRCIVCLNTRQARKDAADRKA